MGYIRWQTTVQDGNGNAVFNPSITVRNADDNSLAAIYDDAGAAKSNPFIGGIDGFVSFSALPGRYKIEGVKGGSVAPDWYVDLAPSDRQLTPEDFGASVDASNNTTALNAWLASGRKLSAVSTNVYEYTGSLTFPNGVSIDCGLSLKYTGANSASVFSIGNDAYIEELRFNSPTATGITATIGTGFRSRYVEVEGAGGGTSFLTIANTSGIDIGRLVSLGGFQRPFVLGNAVAWSTGGRIGHVLVRDYTRAIGINYLDGFWLGGCDFAVKNAAAGYESGHNGLLITGLRNSYIGDCVIENAGEHSVRVSGDPSMGASYGNVFGDIYSEGPGGCALKINPDIVAYDFRFGDITAVGTFATTPGGNREVARLSHCRNISFGRITALVADGASFSCQDVLTLNDATDIDVAHIHAEGIGQSVIDFAAGQDIGSGLPEGDVRRITIGGLTGISDTSKPIIRIDAIVVVGLNTYEIAISDVSISGLDYFTDGLLVTAEALADVDGPISVSGRIRKTDLTTLPIVTNMPDQMTVFVMVGDIPAVSFRGALVDARIMTQPFANRAAAVAAAPDFPPAIQRLEWVTPRGDTVAVVRKAGSTMIVDLPGWVPDGVATVDHFGENTTPGTTDMQTPLANLMASGMTNALDADTYRSSRVTITQDDVLRGEGSNRTIIRRAATGNMVTAANARNARIAGLTFDLATDTITGTVNGQGISASGSDMVMQDVTIRNIGGTGGGGSGLVMVTGTLDPRAQRTLLRDMKFFGTTATVTDRIGWVLTDVEFSHISNMYAENITTGLGAAHELKNNAQWNTVFGTITNSALAGFYMGQQTVGLDGADYNAIFGTLAKRVTQGIVIGEGIGNLFMGAIHDTTGAPSASNMRSVFISGGSSQNYVDGAMTFGAMQYSAYLSGNNNYVGMAAHDTGPKLLGITSGYGRNLVDVKHPGPTRTTIRGMIDDSSGIPRGTVGSNVIYCSLLGEEFGSASGYRLWQMTPANVTPGFDVDHVFRFEHGTEAVLALATSSDGTSRRAGWSHSFGTTAERGGVYHDAIPGLPNEDVMTFRVGNTDLVTLGRTLFAAITDVARDLGSAARRWRDVFAQNIRPGAGTVIWTSGAGSPEGVVTAIVGSMYTRTDGGAGSTLYIKESGTGNTGWVAK